ncbi:unnamed protein product, partial [Cyprideis torosa]
MANFFPSTSAPKNLDQLEVMEEERAWTEVRRFFSHLEWNTAPEFRKNYWKNELVNYDTFRRAGFKVTPPDFMRQGYWEDRRAKKLDFSRGRETVVHEEA